MCLPLTGRTIAVTRPRAQAGELAAAIEQAGGTALIFPLLEIVPSEDHGQFERALSELDTTRLAIFISPNAVSHSVPAILARRAWPDTLAIAAVGQGTARGLHDLLGRAVICPTRHDSEGLLALPELASGQIAGQRIAIFKGEGGRDLLESTLRERGAIVHPVPCYRRLPPPLDPAPLFGLADAGRLDAILVTSSEAMKYLGELFGPARQNQLQNILIVVPHPRIAEAARRLGCRRILQCSGGDAANDNILAALSTYNWPSTGTPST